MRARILTAAAIVASTLVLASSPAQAAGKVSVTNDQGSSKADPTYATTLTLKGSGFQSIKGGHGGVYVFFGTVKGTWQPSKGGVVGTNYLYVPDSESKSNQGFQKFVAFPGSDTAAAANGGEIKANGTWSTKIVVPGVTFNAVDREGNAAKVDCRKVTCGIITIGAHGVKNATNESFTPVTFGDLYGGEAPATTAPTTPAPTAATPTETTAAPEAAPVVAGTPTITVDRSTAAAGKVLVFNATGLRAGDQVVASLDDGAAAVGPLSVGPNGQVSGALQLPADLTAGTHELKLTGGESTPLLTFPISGNTAAVADVTDDDTPWVPIAFAAVGAVALLGAVLFSILRVRSLRRKAAAHAV